MPRPSKADFLVAFILFNFILSGYSYAQAQPPVVPKGNAFSYFQTIWNDSSKKFTRANYYEAKRAEKLHRQHRTLSTCRTTTFFMHLSAATNEKIAVKDVLTVPGGDFKIFGNVTLQNGEQQGLVMRVATDGSILSKSKMQVNGKPATISQARVMLDGNIAVAGMVNDGTNKVFATALSDDLSTVWLQTFDLPGTAFKLTMSLDYSDVADIDFAVQLSSSVICFNLTQSGLYKWSSQVQIPGLNDLAGFNYLLSGKIGLLVNCIIGGKRTTQILEIDRLSGSVTAAANMGEGDLIFKGLQTTYFNGRLTLLSVVSSVNNQFALRRDIMYSSANSETSHTYTLGGGIDFSVSGALDNAGDALGFCLPQAGKMIFIRHFDYYQTTPEYTREYTVPAGASISSVVRSVDGGYLFALNTQDSKGIILIKTDSIGSLAGCSYQDVKNNFREEIRKQNTAIDQSSVAYTATSEQGLISTHDATVAAVFDCRQTYCPDPPATDTCLSTYFKTLRSNSYLDLFGSYNLMRNNRQLVYDERIDRINGNMNYVTPGLKVFDESGAYIKGEAIFFGNNDVVLAVKKVSDSSIMLVSYSANDNIPSFTFTVVTDDLKILWTASVKIPDNYFFTGTGFSDFVKDDEGNYYLVGAGGGFYSDPIVQVYKFSAAGTPLWIKSYALKDANNVIIYSSGTTTSTGIVIVAEGSSHSVAVRFDKQTGEILNSFTYNGKPSGSLFHRLLQFGEGRIYYVGDDHNNNLTLSLFDTTGKPIKSKTFNNSSIPRATVVKDGMLYTYYTYYNGTGYKNVLLKADSALNVQYKNEYDVTLYGFPSGMEVSKEGNIYMGGNYFYGGINGSYADPYIMKYNDKGELGTCSFTPGDTVTINNDLQAQPLDFTPLSLSYTLASNTVSSVTDDYGQVINAVLCSSQPQCNFIKITGDTSVCGINKPFVYKGNRNSFCTVQPRWLADTSYATLKNTTDSTVTFTFKKPGRTWIRALLNVGCSNYEDSLPVYIQPDQNNFSLGRDTTLCPGESVSLHAGSNFNSYLWNTGSKDSVIKAKNAGIYAVTVTNSCNDTFTDSIVITAAIVPPLRLGQDTATCSGDTLIQMAPAGFSGYFWKPVPVQVQDSGQRALFALAQNTRISVQAVTAAGCFAADTLEVTVKKANAIMLGADTSFCNGDSITLNAGNGFRQYSWNTGSTRSNISVNTPGTYIVTATASNDCVTHDTLTVLQLYSRPVVALGNDFSLCYGNRKILDAGNYSTYRWQDNSTGQYFTVKSAGTYYVTVTSSDNCTAGDTIVAKALLTLPANFLPAIDSICDYDTKQLSPSGNFNSYTWSNGAAERTITITAAGSYWLTVTDSNGCVGSDTVRVVYKDCMQGLYIPSAFTPNGDGRNDVFKALLFGPYLYFQLSIYNRFGEVVFSTSDPHKGWDGTINGSPQDKGTFVYQCNFQLQGSKPATRKGTIVLVR